MPTTESLPSSTAAQSVPLPSFRKPPVIEVSFGIQFEELRQLRAPQIGLYFGEVASRGFKNVQEQHPLPKQVESFVPLSQNSVGFEFSDIPEIPRYWFIKPDNHELIQLQGNRFLYNWRRHGDPVEYPRYDTFLRQNFVEALDHFFGFVDRNSIGPIRVGQCELTYFNQIPTCSVWENVSQFSKAVNLSGASYSDDFLPAPQSIRAAHSFLIPHPVTNEPVGRLHTEASTAKYVANGKDLISLQITARGLSLSPDQKGILDFMDLGRVWIVRGFKSVTTPEMHRFWEEIQ